MSDEPVGGQEQRPEGSRSSQETGDARSPSASGQPSAGRASPDAAEQRALMTEPLPQLQEGDRVVHEVALLDCPGESPFRAGTETLVPVEAARGD